MIRIVLAATIAVGALAAPAIAAQRPLGQIGSLPAGWSHAQINVVIKRQPHTLTYDRGRVQAVTPAALTLRERDGVVVTVPVSSSTVVTVNGRPATLAAVRLRLQVMTVSLDGAPAAAVRIQVAPGVAAALLRQGAAG